MEVRFKTNVKSQAHCASTRLTMDFRLTNSSISVARGGVFYVRLVFSRPHAVCCVTITYSFFL